MSRTLPVATRLRDDPGVVAHLGDSAVTGTPIDWRRLALPAGCFTTGMGGALVVMTLFSPQELPAFAIVACWLVYPIVGAVVLDARPASGLGQLLCVLGIVPLLLGAYAAAWAGGQPTPNAAVAATRGLTGPLIATLLVAIPMAAAPAPGRPRAVPMLAGAGAALTFASGAVRDGRLPGVVLALASIGWACIATAVTVLLAGLLRATRARPRQAGRSAGWLGIVLLAAIAAGSVAWSAPSAWLQAYLLAAAVLSLPIAVAVIHLAEDFPPPGEVAVNAAVGVAWTGAVVLCHVGVHAWAAVSGLPEPTSAATVAAALVAVGLLPVLLGIRRGALIRRYGSARVPSRLVSELTARLRDGGDPRHLLEIAAHAAADAVRSPSADITLGPDEPIPPEDAAVLSLLVGGDRVGTLVIQPRRTGQPLERRDLAVLEGLAVPVALVARAVALAIQLEHARQDERRRVRADLHDGLGPVLAGLSMRVTAARRMVGGDPAVSATLAGVSEGLAEGRAEVRRIVAGLAPSRIVDADLPRAVEGLVGSLRPSDGPAVELHVDDTLAGVRPAVATAVYRTVAEGLTNALRHATASQCVVEVLDDGAHVRVEVSDDGRGVPVDCPPGVGLASLRDRATALGGRLDVVARPGGGTTMRAMLPKGISP